MATPSFQLQASRDIHSDCAGYGVGFPFVRQRLRRSGRNANREAAPKQSRGLFESVLSHPLAIELGPAIPFHPEQCKHARQLSRMRVQLRYDTDLDQPYDGEIFCVETDGAASTVWRFAPDRAAYVAPYFQNQPLGNVSRNGRYYLFTSDWDGQLGTSSDRTTDFAIHS
jgi:hypothetical protein